MNSLDYLQTHIDQFLNTLQFTPIDRNQIDPLFTRLADQLDVILQSIDVWIKSLQSLTYAMDQPIYPKDFNHLKEQLLQMKQTNQKTRMLNHDLRNHLLSIKTLVEAHKEQEALEYIDTMYSFMQTTTYSIQSGNLVFDTLLQDKFNEAATHQISVDYDISLPSSLAIKDFDYATIIGNALDNAIEAAKQVHDKQKRRIGFVVKYKDPYILFEIENTYKAPIIEVDQQYLSTKDNREAHGKGINNMKQAIEHYDGIINIEYDETTFKVLIMLDTIKER